eukprot:scaffold1514_cov132-Isochrysis_galbana.AAC.5
MREAAVRARRSMSESGGRVIMVCAVCVFVPKYIGQHVALIQGVPVSIEWTALVACGPQLQWHCNGQCAPSTVTVILLRADVGCNRPGPPPWAHIGQCPPVAGPAPTRAVGRTADSSTARGRPAYVGVGPHPIVGNVEPGIAHCRPGSRAAGRFRTRRRRAAVRRRARRATRTAMWASLWGDHHDEVAGQHAHQAHLQRGRQAAVTRPAR